MFALCSGRRAIFARAGEHVSNDLVPITDEQAKAVQEVAKVVGQSIEAVSGFFSWCAEVVGDAPHDAFAWLIGDRWHHARIRNLYKIRERTEEILRQRSVKDRKPVSENIATPLLEAARQEDSPEIRELYAGLLAAAMDPARANAVRPEFIDAVKRFHPRDAVIMRTIYRNPGQLSPNSRDYFSGSLKSSSDATEVAFRNLERIGCVSMPSVPANSANWFLTAFGRELMAACSA